jgi:hypothetical protein
MHSVTVKLDGGKWSASCPDHFTPRERAPGTHWIEGGIVYSLLSIFNPTFAGAGFVVPSAVAFSPILHWEAYLNCGTYIHKRLVKVDHNCFLFHPFHIIPTI